MLINIMTVYMLCYVGKNKCIIIIIIIIITTSEVRSIILKSTNASCDLDPFPTRLLKHYIDDDLIVPITAIINLSMREGVAPPAFKQALVNPLIKPQLSVKNTGEDCSQTPKCTHRRTPVIKPCTIWF